MIEIYQGLFQTIFRAFSFVAWIIVPLILFSVLWNLRLIYIRKRFLSFFDWRVFELKIPKDVLKTPKAMEHIFASISSIYSGLSSLDKYWNGKVQCWISFEMVGYGGGVYFYVVFPLFNYKNLIESVLYAQYPDAEIREVEDYTELMSSALPNEIYDIWGTDFVLARENYLPIKTYIHFEDSVEERRIDPLAAIIEVMSNLKEGEMIWLQFLVSPLGGDALAKWKKEGEDKIAQIVGRKVDKKEGGPLSSLWYWAKNLFMAPIEHPTWPGDVKEEAAQAIKFLSPDEQDMVKEIAGKISKLAFETIIRFVYIDRRDSFSPLNIAAVKGSFFQFNTPHLNAFKFGKEAVNYDSVLAKIIPKYKEMQLLRKKRRIFDNYKQRRFGRFNRIKEEKYSILNIEELATVYHVPAIMVKAPKLKRLESKKGEPPAELPIEK